MQICACAWIYRWTKNLHTGPPGLRAAGTPGRRAAEPPGRRGPSRAAGRGLIGLRAAGPLGRRGPWAAGLLLAKPIAHEAKASWAIDSEAMRARGIIVLVKSN